MDEEADANRITYEFLPEL